MINKTIKLQADLVCETSLHIGNQEGGNQPRGLNAPMLQNPVLQINNSYAPYISATSLKGKLRNIAEILFEKHLNRKFVDDYDEEKKKRRVLKRHECDSLNEAKKCAVCCLFGSSSGSGNKSNEDVENENFDGRLLFRNAPLKQDSALKSSEIKTENKIHRLRQEANPRSIERALRHSIFELEIVYLVHDNENVNKQLSNMIACLRFLENNYLGGNGSRGYGKIKFTNILLNGNKQDSLEDLQRSLLLQEEKV